MHKVIALLPALLLAGVMPARAENPAAIVTHISDGDTITVRIGTVGDRLRLACIDAPEKKQRGSAESLSRLSQLLPPNTPVTLRVVERDRYGRLVAEVYRNNTSVNLQMVQEGQAVVYRRYLKACQETQQQYLNAENTAKQAHWGFWRFSPVCLPADFRQHKCQ